MDSIFCEPFGALRGDAFLASLALPVFDSQSRAKRRWIRRSLNLLGSFFEALPRLSQCLASVGPPRQVDSLELTSPQRVAATDSYFTVWSPQSSKQ